MAILKIWPFYRSVSSFDEKNLLNSLLMYTMSYYRYESLMLFTHIAYSDNLSWKIYSLPHSIDNGSQYISSRYDVSCSQATTHFYFDYLPQNETHRDDCSGKHLTLLHKQRFLFDCCVLVLIVYPCQLCKLQWLAPNWQNCCHCSSYAAFPFKFKLISSLRFLFLLRLLGLSSLSLMVALLLSSDVRRSLSCESIDQSNILILLILLSSTVTILSSLSRRS
jgi:hypothetical protein